MPFCEVTFGKIYVLARVARLSSFAIEILLHMASLDNIQSIDTTIWSKGEKIKIEKILEIFQLKEDLIP